MHDDKVLIAGAGIVGGILGKILKQNKVPFQIIEKEKGYRANPNRTVALTKESIVFLNSLDEKMDLNEWSTPIKQMKLYKDDTLNLELSSDDYEKLSSVCSLDELHKKVFDGIEEHICYGENIEKIQSLKSKVLVQTDKQKHEGGFLFGADGINSKVRSLLNFKQEEWFYGQKAYVSKVEAKHKNIAHQYFTKSGTIALLPYDKGKEYFSIIFCTNTTLDPTEQFQDYVKELNININLTTLDNFEGGFDLKHQRVSKMNYEKILLCGDAANTFHPMAGQSLNLGIGDTMNIKENLFDILMSKNESHHQYNKKRSNKNIQMTWIIQSLHGAFSNPSFIQDLIIGNGMKLLNQHPKIKEKIIDYANRN
tara:strand:+ start:34437 stop:35534 length:1098 start_codon:yes stop_codon:yes gene_type:complete